MMKFALVTSSFVLTALALLSCAHPFAADTALLRPWDAALAKEQPFSGPFIAQFRAGDRELQFLATPHASGVNSTPFRVVKSVLAEFSPEVLVAEGFSPTLGQDALRRAPKKCDSTFSNCGESLYAISLLEADAKIVSGEPSEEQVVKALNVAGYSSCDLAFFYFVRQIPQLRREHVLKQPFAPQADQLIAKFSKTVGLDETCGAFSDFVTWYKSKMGRVFLETKVDSETPAPHRDGTYLQQLSHEVGSVRDRHAVQTIAAQLRLHKKVLVIFGSSHFQVQRLVLEKMMGQPTFLQIEGIAPKF